MNLLCSSPLPIHPEQGKVVRAVQHMASWLGMGRGLQAVAQAPTLADQRAAWERLWLVRLLRAAPAWLLSVIADLAGMLCFNRLTLWYGGGIPWKQYQVRYLWDVRVLLYCVCKGSSTCAQPSRGSPCCLPGWRALAGCGHTSMPTPTARSPIPTPATSNPRSRPKRS